MTNEALKEVPFLPSSVNSNPNFVPVKIGASAADLKQPKPPKPPEKPLMPYMRYSRKVWDHVKAANQECKLWEIGKIIGGMWRDLSPSEKQKFQEEYENEKHCYADAIRQYHNSPAYQQYLSAKDRVQSQEEKEKGKPQLKHEAKVMIQACEDEEDGNQAYSAKHIAAARYQRNQKLLFELFSEAGVPDTRTIVTTQRMGVLKRQVLSLNMHQQKLESELEQLEKKFLTKKARLVESGQNFLESMEKLRSYPVITEASFQQLVEQASEKLLQQYMQLPNGHKPAANLASVVLPTATTVSSINAIANTNGGFATTNETPNGTLESVAAGSSVLSQTSAADSIDSS